LTAEVRRHKNIARACPRSNNVPEKRMARQDEIAARIADEMADCGISLVASLPDNWINPLIGKTTADPRFVHVAVNREESALAMCSGAFLSGKGSVALMGASGFMTLVYAITKISYTYEIPVFYMITLRGTFDDNHKYHVSNGIYLQPVLDAINMPFTIIDKESDLPMIGKVYKYTRTFSKSAVVALTRGFLR
jgi:sulfopyruvate decarboxylase subunit alpha